MGRKQGSDRTIQVTIGEGDDAAHFTFREQLSLEALERMDGVIGESKQPISNVDGAKKILEMFMELCIAVSGYDDGNDPQTVAEQSWQDAVAAMMRYLPQAAGGLEKNLPTPSLPTMGSAGGRG